MTSANDTIELVPMDAAFERRAQPRVKTNALIKFITKDGIGKRLVINFKAKNISQSGFCLEMNDWPDFKAPITSVTTKHLHMVIALTLNEKTTRIYHVKAYLRHRTPGHGIGFFFMRMKE